MRSLQTNIQHKWIIPRPGAQMLTLGTRKPIDCAWRWILNGLLDAAAAFTVQAMFDDGFFSETGQFSVINKIVPGLLAFKDLEAKLQASMSAINDVDVGGRSAISWAAERADISAIQLLLSYGAEHASPNNSGAHPLNYAAIAKDPAAMHTLLGHGVEVDSCNAHGHTPLQSARQT
jgi:ankyrin repeat protein